jgi:hypothetical protein
VSREAARQREVWLRNVEMRGCDAVPCKVHLSPALCLEHGSALRELLARYPHVEAHCPEETELAEALGEQQRAGEPFQDAWSCVWHNLHDGMTGQVSRPALADWDELERYEPPSPAESGHFGSVDWDHEERLARSARAEGALVRGAVAHGFFFQRLCYLRGFENLMLDVARADPRLDRLCEMVFQFNRGLVERHLALGVDVMHFGDDLGIQDRLAVSPAAWRRYVGPAYARLFGACRRAGAHVHLHTDGYVVDIMPDLVECGVTILNPQDLCNGLDAIRWELKGRVCVDLDLDRQLITARGTPEQVDGHVRRCVETLGSPRGGLMLTWGAYPGVPLKNVEAVFRAMSRYRSLPARSAASGPCS